MCIRLPVIIIPTAIIELCNLHELICNRFVCIKVRGGMHGHLEAGQLAHNKLVNYLKPYGYEQVRLTPGLWTNKQNSIAFTLVVDNFSIKYKEKNINYLINVLKEKYTITIDIRSSLFCGVTLEWQYNVREVRYSMPGYILKLLKKLNY